MTQLKIGEWRADPVALGEHKANMIGWRRHGGATRDLDGR
jgi:hypothetical protein